MIDSHCHLDDRAFGGQQHEYVTKATEAGVGTIVNIGVHLKSSRRSIELAERFSSVYATVGVHPHDAKSFDDTSIDELRKLAGHPKVVAIGEIGLDYYRDFSPRPIQRKVFERQLQLAVEAKMPVVIHTRESFEDTMSVVKEYASSLSGGVFHCFQGTIDDANRVFELGFVISVGGIITFPKSRMSDLAAQVPLDKVILETDAPYLTPVPHRGKPNEPSFVAFVYRKMAELRSVPVTEIETRVDRTCRKLYRLEEVFGG